ncbi:hypothetical protein IV203_018776 [Nitzschia inconspicua]|uniref:Uncharacterized protein n=1 Tax=Nitzschia inconspicua TaxID=303405 RepID=A0A9K3M2M6_9STRA|nr:hypothetical protein IV203_018776 [Nitzschia inconspicua]
MTKNRSGRTTSTFSTNPSSKEMLNATVGRISEIVLNLSEDDCDDASSFCSSMSGSSIDISGHDSSGSRDRSSTFPLLCPPPPPAPPLSTPPPPLVVLTPEACSASQRLKGVSQHNKEGKSNKSVKVRQLSNSTVTSYRSSASESRWDSSSTKDSMPTVSPGILRKRPATIDSHKNGWKSRDVPILTSSLLFASRSRSLASLSPRSSSQSTKTMIERDAENHARNENFQDRTEQDFGIEERKKRSITELEGVIISSSSSSSSSPVNRSPTTMPPERHFVDKALAIVVKPDHHSHSHPSCSH